MNEYLKLPIRFQQLFEQNKLETCTLQNSIFRNLHLLITTTIGENKQNDQFGSDFWDHDYDIHMSNDSRKEMVISSLKNQINLYEKRLSSVVIEVNVKQISTNENGHLRLRRRIEIIVHALVTRSNEPFRFATGFFIGPLTFD